MIDGHCCLHCRKNHNKTQKLGSRSRSVEAMGTPSTDGSSGKGRRILPSLRRISTTPLRHQPRRRSSSSSSDSSCPTQPPPLKQPPRPNALRSAATAAARKTRRLLGAKSNEILPGIFFCWCFFFFQLHGSLSCVVRLDGQKEHVFCRVVVADKS